jgi:hypothetical protein
MGAYDLEYRGYFIESAWGTSQITGAGDTAYWIGVEAPNSTHPWIQRETQRAVASPLNEYSTTIYEGKQVPRATIFFAPLDGVPLWWAMGESSNAGAGAPYTHTLSFRDGSGAAPPDPPSMTWHRERVDSAGGLTDHRLQVTGLRVETCMVRCFSQKLAPSPLLTMELGVVGKTHTHPTYSLSTKPSSRISAATCYTFDMLTTKTLGGNDLKGLSGFELWWTRPLLVQHVNQNSGGTDLSHQVYAHYFGQLDGPYLRLHLEVEEYDNAGFEDVTAASGTKDLSLILTRGTNDTITFTGTDLRPTGVTDPMLKPDARLPSSSVEGPMEQLGITVVDSLAGATHYA